MHMYLEAGFELEDVGLQSPGFPLKPIALAASCSLMCTCIAPPPRPYPALPEPQRSMEELAVLLNAARLILEEAPE